MTFPIRCDQAAAKRRIRRSLRKSVKPASAASTTLPEPERLMSSLSASISATDALPDPDTQRSIREPAMRSIDTLPEPLSATEDRAGVEMLSVTSPPGRPPGPPAQPERSGRTIRVRPCTVTPNRAKIGQEAGRESVGAYA